MLEKGYSFESHGIIWRVMYDKTLRVILLEMRDGDQKEVSFAALNVKTGEVLWEGLQLEENWWISMAGVSNGFLYFSEFEKDNAIPKVKKLQKLRIEDAVLVEDDSEDPQELLSAEDFELPIVYPKESEHNNTLTDFLKQKGFHLEDQDIHYYQTPNEIIFVFLDKNNGVLQRKLVICDTEGEVIFSEVMDKKVQNQIMDSFFVVENMLLYIKEKEMWCGLPLSTLNKNTRN